MREQNEDGTQDSNSTRTKTRKSGPRPHLGLCSVACVSRQVSSSSRSPGSVTQPPRAHEDTQGLSERTHIDSSLWVPTLGNQGIVALGSHNAVFS